MRAGRLYGAIEAGGTKFRCVVGSGPENIVAETMFATRGPHETLRDTVDFFRPFAGKIQGLGLGSFGPLDLKEGSPTYGYITSTPKPEWANTDIRGELELALELPVAMDTDVNAAALGEAAWGAGQGKDPLLYLTVGTGIGGGLVKNGKPYHGLLTPEMGHMRIPHDPALDPFEGACPYHGDCLEGLAAGPAIQKRLGVPGGTLSDDDPYWEIEAGYLAHGLVNMILVLSPKIIIIGGGVMKRAAIWRSLRSKVQAALNGYVADELILEHIEEYMVPPGLGDRAGLMGAIALAQTGAAE